MAALVAGRAGLRVFLADEGSQPGGSLLSRTLTIGGRPALDWVAETVAELAHLPNVTHLQNAAVWAYREHNYLMVNERTPAAGEVLERNWRVRAGQVIVATGAIERSLVFAGNDRPGVMLAGAAQAYANRWAVRTGTKAVVFTNNDSAYAAAADLAAAGTKIAAIIDSRADVPETARSLLPDVEVLAGHVVTGALGTRQVNGAKVARIDGGGTRQIACDLLLQSGGWNPTVHLFSQSRGTLRYDETLAAFLPDQPAQKVRCIGAANGEMGLTEALRSGATAGADAAGIASPDTPDATDHPYAIQPLWHVPTQGHGKAFVDIQNDVTVDDVHLALREGYENVEHVKRYTTAGMGLDQGKTGNVNVIGTIAMARGCSLPEVGTTTFRPPYTPVSFGAIGGLRADSVVLPYRHTPLTDWNGAQGAVMYEGGARWQRPGYFPQPGESFQDSVNRESRTVREGVGVYDGSPLGTFEVKGRDTARFLDHIYTNKMSSLAPGRARYGMMLSDDGLILDDGVALRLAEDRWILSTSTGHADAINSHLEELLQTQFPDWNVFVTNVTSQWNNATICGPKARAVMQALGTDIDLTPRALPFMAFADGHVAGFPARVVRVSFTGELSFEVNVAPRHLLALWERVIEVGAAFGIMPVGSEANHVLRVEKGFLSLAHEVDGTADAYDLGLGWLMSKKKADFIGKRSVELRRAGGSVRYELVGLLPEYERAIPEGAPLTPGGAKQATEGFITACVWSVVLERWVALALLENGHSRHGETAHVRLPNGTIPATITRPVFYDPDGERLRS